MQSLLIIDDNPIFRKTVAAILASRFPSLKIMQTQTAAGALHLCQRRNLALVLMDINLSRENGLALLRAIRQNRPQIRIAVVTENDTSEYQRAAYQNGADFFFSKSAHDGRSIIKAVCDCLRPADSCPLPEKSVPLIPHAASINSMKR